jgi:hypothetical protein
MLERAEWLFPLRGRWLAYLFRGVGLLLFAFYALHWLRLREVLPTLVTEAAYFRLETMTTRGLGAYRDGMSMAGRAGYGIVLGPWHLSWLAPEGGGWRMHWAYSICRSLLDLPMAGAGLFVLGGMSRNRKRAADEEDEQAS